MQLIERNYMKDKDKNKEPIITVMCDYCADGLWLNGGAIDADYLVSDLDFNEEDISEIRGLIDIWQQMYETFDLYSSKEAMNEVYSSNDFLLFSKLGEHIYYLFKQIDQDKYIIEYFDEKTSKRTRE